MALTKINQTDLFNAMIERLPLRPSDGGGEGRASMTGEEIRAAFDRAPKLLAESFDRLIEELQSGAIETLPLGANGEMLGSRIARIKALAEANEGAIASHDEHIKSVRTLAETNKDALASHDERLAHVRALAEANEGAITTLFDRLKYVIGLAEASSGTLETHTERLAHVRALAEANEGAIATLFDRLKYVIGLAETSSGTLETHTEHLAYARALAEANEGAIATLFERIHMLEDTHEASLSDYAKTSDVITGLTSILNALKMALGEEVTA